jgi:phosphoglycolate phosphatase-like HAD superfamily hydrolase
MSAPVTAEYSLDDSIVAIAAIVMRTAGELGEKYQAILDLARQREAERQARIRDAWAAQSERLAGLRARVDILEQRALRLAGVLDTPPDLPPSPCGADAETWSAHARQLEKRTLELEAQAASRANQAVRQALEAVADVPDLDNILALYLARRQAQQGEAEQENWRKTVKRVLSRLNFPAGEPLPVRLEMLARDVVLADSPVRAELLANELRLGVQLYRQEQVARQREAEEAAGWLARFPEEALPRALAALLAEVAAGLGRLDDDMRRQMNDWLAAFEAERARRMDEAAAVVLEESLKDLGYQVEAVSETLFAKGGMLHFQRPGWTDYYVRLRVNKKEKTFNFNVVRAQRKNAAEEETNERKRLDFMAEDRWCALFPKLMDTLAARGLELGITRRHEAGELPVQVVSPEVLPRFEREETVRRDASPKTMTLPG